jgi:carbamoylphosphate synthase small subunit
MPTWDRTFAFGAVSSNTSCSDTECDFQQSHKKNALMMKLYGMVSNAGVDTKWIVQLLKQIGVANIDITELAQFMETQVELTESKLYDERMQKIGDLGDDDS